MNRSDAAVDAAALLAARERQTARLARAARRVARSGAEWLFSDAERALLEQGSAPPADPPRTALIHEWEELCRLGSRYRAHRAGDPAALTELVDHFVDSEHVLALMPSGRLPADPAPSIARLLATMKDDLVARAALQGVIEQSRPPSPAGTATLRPRYTPSWGHGSHHLLLGRARCVLVGATPLPARLRLRWSADGFTLSSLSATPRLQIRGRWAVPGEWTIHAPGRWVFLCPTAGPWPLLPPVVDEDGRRSAARYPPPGAAGHTEALLARAPEQAARIEAARAVLAAAWPEGARTVDAFTRALIPVTQRQVVSYSFASVPGWSYLNLYDRDFVDLIDDLCHENAHHHLNHLLTRDRLLRPLRDEPLFYYSPWREALRPLRGLLHSAFTFAVGAELFHRLFDALARGQSLPRRFSPGERIKIAGRGLEETMQVGYTLRDLEHAYRRGRLTEAGHALCRLLARRVARSARGAAPLHAAIHGTPWQSRLARLEARLAEQRRLSRRLAPRLG